MKQALLILILLAPLATPANDCDLGENLARIIRVDECRASNGPNACLMVAMGLGLGASRAQDVGERIGLSGGRTVSQLLVEEPRAYAFMKDVENVIRDHADDYRKFRANLAGKGPYDPKTSFPYIHDRFLEVRNRHRALLNESPVGGKVLDIANRMVSLEYMVKYKVELGRLKKEIQAKGSRGLRAGARDQVAAIERRLERLEKQIRMRGEEVAARRRELGDKGREKLAAGARAGGSVAAAAVVSALGTLSAPAKVMACESKLTADDVSLIGAYVDYRDGLAGACEGAEMSAEQALKVADRLAEGHLTPSPSLCEFVARIADRGERFVAPDLTVTSTLKCENGFRLDTKVGASPVKIEIRERDASARILQGEFVPAGTRKQNQFTVQINRTAEGDNWTSPSVENPTWQSQRLGQDALNVTNLVRFYREKCAGVAELVESEITLPTSARQQKCAVGRTLFAAQQVYPVAELVCAARRAGQEVGADKGPGSPGGAAQ